MINNQTIAVVIPCYNVAGKIETVINKLPECVDHVIVVDDKCPQESGKFVEEKYKSNKKIHVVFNEKNLGVGGAVKKGCLYCLEKKYD